MNGTYALKMINYFVAYMDVVNDCMDAGGTSPWMGEGTIPRTESVDYVRNR